MISLSEARTLIAESVEPLRPVRASLADAVGRVLREEVRAPEDLPGFDRSAMDGYVMQAEDASERLRVVAEIQPGAMAPFQLKRGECARIFTGAAIPIGGSQVLMQEDARREGEWMIPLRRTPARHIRERGEDAGKGDLLLPSGVRIGSGEAALLAQIGATQLHVSAAPRVVHITTGNEIVAPDVQPAPGQIRNSNSTLVAALLAERGAAVLAQKHCSDRLDEMLEVIRSQPDDRWDLLLISGGASVGDYDLGARALEALGFTIHFRKINLRPGKPLIFGTRDEQVAFVLPGNPVSHFVTFHLAVRLALECLEASPRWWPLAKVPLASEIAASGDGRETWCPARLSWSEEIRVAPLTWRSSGDVRGLAGVNALVRVPAGSGAVAAGEIVECLSLEARS